MRSKRLLREYATFASTTRRSPSNAHVTSGSPMRTSAANVAVKLAITLSQVRLRATADEPTRVRTGSPATKKCQCASGEWFRAQLAKRGIPIDAGSARSAALDVAPSASRVFLLSCPSPERREATRFGEGGRAQRTRARRAQARLCEPSTPSTCASTTGVGQPAVVLLSHSHQESVPPL